MKVRYKVWIASLSCVKVPGGFPTAGLVSEAFFARVEEKPHCTVAVSPVGGTGAVEPEPLA